MDHCIFRRWIRLKVEGRPPKGPHRNLPRSRGAKYTGYFTISKRIYEELDQRLSNSKFLSGDNYTIADIGTFPWIARHNWHDIGLSNFENLKRWYLDISKREAVIKGFSFINKGETPPKPDL